MTVRFFDVVALQVPIVYNTYGDHDRDGTIFALAENAAHLRSIGEHFPDPFPDPLTHPDELPVPDPFVRPLVLRVHAGDTVVVRFHNRLRRRAGIHPRGVGYDVRTADGGQVGRNHDSAVEPGGRREYTWECADEGVFLFNDLADQRGGEEGSNAHGLFGALVVEPPDATWTDPVTGDEVTDGLYADVHVPGEPSFREYVVFMQDETDNHNPVNPPHPAHFCDRPRPHGHSVARGQERLVPEIFPEHGDPEHGGHAAGEPAHSMMLMSLRTEPMGWRSLAYERLIEQGRLDLTRDQMVGEEQHHSSWLFGDPSTPILRAYPGDRSRIRLVHAGVKETHVFHLHLHQWHAVPGNERSPIIDSISISPQQAFTIEPIGGAGSVQKATGDIIWHCHLYPHFHAGMWGMWRVFNTMQDGSGHYPDGTPIAALRPLPGHDVPPAPTPRRPGFPGFIPGEFPQKSPRPPRTPLMPEGMGREPTELERDAFCDDPRPGEAFTKSTPDPSAPVRRYDLVVLQGNVNYHTASGHHGNSWHDHRGVFFVLAEEIDEAGGIEEFQRQLTEGTREIEPIAIRGRKGEVIELSLTNELPVGCHASTAFDPVLPLQPECGLHVHLVKFDPLVSDGASVGWNYLSGTATADQGDEARELYRTWIYRWYCDEEFGTVFFHDHLLANERQRHGLFGAMIAEPAGAEWVDPHDHTREVRNANQAVVRLPDGTAFREQVLAMADFVPLVEHGHGEAGQPINPPAYPGGLEDHGTVAVGYRCAPLHERPGAPDEFFSSAVHGDPGTPLLRGYPGEDLRLRLYQGSHEEQHTLTVHGTRWHAWHGDPTSPVRDQQTLGISEAFNLHLDPDTSPGDHLWSFTAADDTWLGAWGLLRLHESEVDDLPALPGAFAGRPLPPFTRPDRRYRVGVVPHEIRYSDQRCDPFGLMYTVDGGPPGETMVLRCRVGEWVEVELRNELSGPGEATPFDPEFSAKDDPERREISEWVSLHAGSLLRTDVRTGDGSYVGENPRSQVKPGDSVRLRWFADREGVVLLQDRADIRDHRHRGLVGALVVEPAGSTPADWTGARTRLRLADGSVEHEQVLVLQDGVRLYHDGDPTQPVTDLDTEVVDQGQKAFNHRSAHLLPRRPSLAVERPETPLLEVRRGEAVRLHLVCGADRGRNHSFEVHGQTWPMEEHLDGPRVGSIGALSAGSVRSLRFTADRRGDWAYRTGQLRWGLSEGLWGLIRVR